MISSMERVLKSGKTGVSLKDNTMKEKNMEWVSSLGRMDLLIPGNSWRITFMEWETTFGTMEENIMESGRTIRWVEMGFFSGQMEGNMKDNTLKIKKKDMEYSDGQMVKHTEKETEIIWLKVIQNYFCCKLTTRQGICWRMERWKTTWNRNVHWCIRKIEKGRMERREKNQLVISCYYLHSKEIHLLIRRRWNML